MAAPIQKLLPLQRLKISLVLFLNIILIDERNKNFFNFYTHKTHKNSLNKNNYILICYNIIPITETKQQTKLAKNHTNLNLLLKLMQQQH